MTELAKSVQKSIKIVTFPTLFSTFWQVLTVSMAKSLPFDNDLKRRFWDPDAKQSI